MNPDYCIPRGWKWGGGILIPYFPSLSPQSRTPNVCHLYPKYRFLSVFGESRFPSSGQFPYRVKKIWGFPESRLYFVREYPSRPCTYPYIVFFPNPASVPKFWRIPLPQKQSNPVSCERFPNPALYFSQIPEPGNTLVDHRSRTCRQTKLSRMKLTFFLSDEQEKYSSSVALQSTDIPFRGNNKPQEPLWLL